MVSAGLGSANEAKLVTSRPSREKSRGYEDSASMERLSTAELTPEMKKNILYYNWGLRMAPGIKRGRQIDLRSMRAKLYRTAPKSVLWNVPE